MSNVQLKLFPVTIQGDGWATDFAPKELKTQRLVAASKSEEYQTKTKDEGGIWRILEWGKQL